MVARRMTFVEENNFYYYVGVDSCDDAYMDTLEIEDTIIYAMNEQAMQRKQINNMWKTIDKYCENIGKVNNDD